MKKLLMSVACCATFLTGMAQTRVPAFEMNDRLGRGVNVSTLEAPVEGSWGPRWEPDFFRVISELGFKHVRLPVQWETTDRSMATPPYTINATFMERIQEVVDAALHYKLHIIVNMHHHNVLYENPPSQHARFIAQWQQIADHFKDYPDSVLFEVMNEPHDNLTAELWNVYFADALTEIRKTNPTRVVLMGVAEYGGLAAIPKLQLPDDEYIIVSPHYYNPFEFTHQGADWVGPHADAWLGTQWHDSEAERETVISEFSYALQYSETHHIPIHVGEFGAYSTADMASRARWTTFLARWFEEQGLSWAYWEFNSGFGFYDPGTKTFRTPLVDALLHNEMPEPTPVIATPVYTSNYSAGTDGWTLGTQGGGAGSLSTSASRLQVAITSPGTEAWHVQLVRQNIPLEKGKSYRISFTARAAADRTVMFYTGKASNPWTIYSGNNSATLTTSDKRFAFTFTMTNPSDPASRLVFDLGLNITNVNISEVTVEEIQYVITSAEEKLQRRPEVYPNPVDKFLYSTSLTRYRIARVYDLNGRLLSTIELPPGTTEVGLEHLTPGLYVLRLTGNGVDDRVKIVKN